MGSMSLMHWLVVLAIVLVLFGAGKLPRVMGDFAKGIKAFKSGMKEEDQAAATTPPAQVTPPAGAAASTASAGVGDRSRDHAWSAGFEWPLQRHGGRALSTICNRAPTI